MGLPSTIRRNLQTAQVQVTEDLARLAFIRSEGHSEGAGNGETPPGEDAGR